MKIHKLIILVGVTSISATLSAYGQNFETPKEEAIPTSYNFRIGDRTFLTTGAGVEFSFNDNITLTRNNPKSDFIITPAVQFGIIHQFSKQFRLRLALDIGYTKYLNYDELDHFTIVPNGGNDFEFSLRLADRWILRVSDTFSLTRVPIVNNTPLGFGGIMVFNNIARIAIDADYNTLVLGANYTNSLSLHLDNKYRFLDLMQHTGEAFLGVRVTKPVLLGIRGSVSYLDYLRNDKNDAISFVGSLYGNFVIARNLNATASAGYQLTDFTSRRGVKLDGVRYRDDSDYGNFIFTFGLNHELSRNASHSILASRSMHPGYLSNYQDNWSVSYNLRYSYTRYLTTDFMFDYINFNSSDGKNFRGLDGETYAFSVGVSLALSRYVNLVGKYQIRWSDTNRNNSDFVNNIITVGLNSRF